MRILRLAAIAGMLAGCAASVKEIRHHPQQARLERILAAVAPHTTHPDAHYWGRVSEPTPKTPIGRPSRHPPRWRGSADGRWTVGLAIFPQRHIYVSSALLDEADEAVVTALVVHGVAHHRLHHGGQRMAVQLLQRSAFKAGGYFVPGLSHGKYVGGPLIDVMLNAGQEPQADAKTIEYLARMGASGQDWLRALEFLGERGYAERVGHVVLRREDFNPRIAALREPPPSAVDASRGNNAAAPPVEH